MPRNTLQPQQQVDPRLAQLALLQQLGGQTSPADAVAMLGHLYGIQDAMSSAPEKSAALAAETALHNAQATNIPGELATQQAHVKALQDQIAATTSRDAFDQTKYYDEGPDRQATTDLHKALAQKALHNLDIPDLPVTLPYMPPEYQQFFLQAHDPAYAAHLKSTADAKAAERAKNDAAMQQMMTQPQPTHSSVLPSGPPSSADFYQNLPAVVRGHAPQWQQGAEDMFAQYGIDPAIHLLNILPFLGNVASQGAAGRDIFGYIPTTPKYRK